MTQQYQTPQLLIIDEQSFSQNHAEHWQLLSNNQQQVMQWLHIALDSPISPMGLCPNEQGMNQNFWFIQGPKQTQDIQCSQILCVKDNKPYQLKHAFPSLNSPYAFPVTIKQITTSESHSQAILCLALADDCVIYAFDNYYSINQDFYQQNQKYKAHFSAWAYQLELVPEHETITIDDPEAIRHHRALNDILAEHHGQTPDNLQDLLQDWQPKSEEDKQPIQIDISKTTAYLYGDHVGQEDEAWLQGKIVGKMHSQFMNETYTLYDVVFIDEQDSEKILLRLATKNPDYAHFNIGQFIRGDIWLQVNIYETCNH